MEREIRVRWVGDTTDLKRAIDEARRAFQDVEKGAAQSASKMADEFRKTGTEAKRVGDEAAKVSQAVSKMGKESAQASQEVRKVGDEAAKTTTHLKSMEREGGASAGHLLGELGKLTAGFVALSGAAAVFAKGIGQNAEMESIKLGMATIVSANETIKDAQGKQVEGAQKLAVAQGQVADVFEKIKQDAINTTATLPQLAGAFNAALPTALAMGVSLDDTRKLTVGMVQAMSAMGIPLDQARQEINSILQGQITSDSQLAKSLGLNNQMVETWKQQGTLVDHLHDKLKDFTVAGQAASETWAGAASNLQDNIGKLLQLATSDSFDTLKKQVNDLNNTGFGPDAQKEAAHWGAIINDSLTTALQTAGSIGTLLLQGAGKFREAMDGIRIWGAHMGGEQYRAEQFNQLLGTFKVGGLVTSGNQNMLSTASKAALTMAPPDTPSSWLIKTAQMGGLGGKELQRFTKGLEAIDKQVNDGISGQVDDILNGWQKTIDDALTKAKNRPKVAITPNKPAPTAPKKAKAAHSTHIGTLYGPELPTPADQIRVTMGEEFGPATSDVTKGYIEAEKALAAWRKQDEKELQEIRDSHNKKNEQAEKDLAELRMKLMVDGLNSVSNLVAQSIQSGKGPSGGDYLRMGGGLASTAALAIPGIGIPLSAGIGAASNIGGAILDRQDHNRDVLETVANGGTVDRKDYLSALQDKHTTRFGLLSKVNEGAVNADLKSFDDKNFNRLMLGTLSGPTADRDRATSDLSDQVAKMLKEGMPVDQANAYKAAKEAEIKATYQAAKAAEEFGKKASNFSTTMTLAGMKESLGLGAVTASDIKRGLDGAGLDEDKVFSRLGDKGVLQSLLGELEYLKKDADAGGAGFKNPYGYWAAKNSLGSAGVDISGMDEASVIKMLEQVLLPAAQQITQMTASKDIGSVNAGDNSLTFDAPQTRVLNVTQTISLNTYAVTGDKASFRALVKDIMAEANTVLGQAV